MYKNMKEMCLELASLEMTIKRQDYRKEEELQKNVMKMVRDSNFELSQMASWASKVLQEFFKRKNIERHGFDGRSSSYLGSIPIIKAHTVLGSMPIIKIHVEVEK